MTTPNVDVRCPRCGYDQRGVMATWTTECPLEGTCAECGMAFAWSDVLNPSLILPPWWVETRRSVRAFPRQFIGTTWRAWLSPLLWRAARMTHAIHRGRLIAWLATWLVILVVTLAVCNGVMTVAFCAALLVAPGGSSGLEVFIHATLLPLSKQPIGNTGWGGGPLTPRMVLGTLLDDSWWLWLIVLAVPLASGAAFATLPISRRRAKVRWAHIVRATVYAWGPCASVVLLLVIRRAFVTSILISTLTAGSATALAFDVVATLMSVLASVGLVLLVPAVLVYWHACARRYLHMQHAWAVALSVTIMGFFAPISIASLLWYLLD